MAVLCCTSGGGGSAVGSALDEIKVRMHYRFAIDDVGVEKQSGAARISKEEEQEQKGGEPFHGLGRECYFACKFTICY